MLHVAIQKPFDEAAKCAHFTVGDEAIKDLNPELVQSVLADGPELVEIIKQFEGIPKRFRKGKIEFTPEESQSWFGDDAKFIVANWL